MFKIALWSRATGWGHRVLWGGLSVLFCLFVSSCGKKIPPPHPAGNLGERTIARKELVPLIVHDEERVEKIQKIYDKVWEMVREFDLKRNAEFLRLVAGGGIQDPEKENISRMLFSVRELGAEKYKDYVRLMLEVRELTTAQEYAALIRASGAPEKK